MKKVLIISPTFPPVNSADMHRVRLSLPHYEKLGWLPIVMTVDDKFVESYSIDPLLLKSVPCDIKVIKIKALNAHSTRKFGVGSLSMRSLYNYNSAINKLLSKEKFDLLYFSTTAFHVLLLGPIMKRKFGIPFIIDIQDPWRNDYYLDKPQSERPPKFLLSHKINSILEKFTIPKSNGVISVSSGYVKMLLNRYPEMHSNQFKTIPFGASRHDFEISKKYLPGFLLNNFNNDCKNLVYIGRGGYDMHFSITAFLKAFSRVVSDKKYLTDKVHIWFIGTSYSTLEKVPLKIKEIANGLGLNDHVTEMSSRVSFYQTLSILKKASILLAIGSVDKNYTASKICQYILAARPLLSVFHIESDVINILKNCNAGEICSFNDEYSENDLIEKIKNSLLRMLDENYEYVLHNQIAVESYLDKAMTKEQTDFFDKIASN